MVRLFRAGVIVVVVAASAFHCVACRGADGAPAGGHDVMVNSIGMRLVRIRAGEFMMGSHESAAQVAKAFPYYGRKIEIDDEFPRHRVRITRDFYMGQYEVTVGQFRKFVEAPGYRTEPERDGYGGWGYNRQTQKCEGPKPCYSWRNTGFRQTDDHPVVNVTWNDAVAFCQWLSRKEAVTYRLPTEAEWEYAARAGTATRYHSGDDPLSLKDVANTFDPSGKAQFGHIQDLTIPPDFRFTTPVGSFKPNRWGLYDMHGNVWEWCSDWHDDEYYARSPLENPTGPEHGTVRVRRGGAWNSFPIWVRVSFRNWNSPDSRCVNLGFRVVREISAMERARGD